jgi:hypothetical protein
MKNIEPEIGDFHRPNFINRFPVTGLSYHQARKIKKKLIEKQNGLCGFCNMPLDVNLHSDGHSWKNMKKFQSVVEHRYDTGEFRSIVHFSCNILIKNYERTVNLRIRCPDSISEKLGKIYIARYGLDTTA